MDWKRVKKILAFGKPKKKNTLEEDIKEWIVSFIVAAAIYFVIMPAIFGSSSPAVVVSSCSEKGNLNIGDIILTKIISFDRTRDPQIMTNERGLGKLRGGRLVEIEAAHIPRVIGKKGTMINMVKRLTRTQIITAQNGRIWVQGKKTEDDSKTSIVF